MIIQRNVLNKIVHDCAILNKNLPSKSKLTKIYFVIKDGDTYIKCTNATCDYSYYLKNITLGDQGVYVVDGWKFIGTIGALINEEIDLNFKDMFLYISTKQTVVKLILQRENSVPIIHKVIEENMISNFEVNNNKLFFNNILKCLTFAEDKGTLASVNISIVKQKQLYMQSCNSRGACITHIDLDEPQQPFDITIGRTEANALLEVFKGVKNLQIRVYDTYIVALGDDMKILIKLIDVKYPFIRTMLCRDTVCQLPYFKHELTEVLSLASVLSESYKLLLQYTDQVCTITFDDCVNKRFQYKHIDVETPITLGVDYRLLKSVFKYVDDVGYIEYGGSNTAPLLIKSDKDIFMIMPMLT